jgi:hypothetical protein
LVAATAPMHLRQFMLLWKALYLLHLQETCNKFSYFLPPPAKLLKSGNLQALRETQTVD